MYANAPARIKMEEEDIDAWYEDEKQKAMDNYLKCIEEGKDKKISEEKYSGRMKYVIETYNRLMTEKLSMKKTGKFQTFMYNLRAKMMMKK